MRAHGFTLLELLLVILITGVIAIVAGPVIVGPIRGYADQELRAELVDSADQALRRIARDVRNGLPYSLRVAHTGSAIEMINVIDAARYRSGGSGNGGQRLTFTNGETSFNLTGRFTRLDNSGTAYAYPLVIYNLGPGVPDQNAYDGDRVLYADGFVLSDDGGAFTNEDRISMNNNHRFDSHSPERRIFVVDQSISYACTGGGLYRLTGYGIDPATPALATIATGVLLTDNVSSCAFRYDPGGTMRPGLLMMSITLAKDGESITLLHQVQVNNAS